MLWTTKLIRRHILSPGVYVALITVRVTCNVQLLAVFSSYSALFQGDLIYSHAFSYHLWSSGYEISASSPALSLLNSGWTLPPGCPINTSCLIYLHMNSSFLPQLHCSVFTSTEKKHYNATQGRNLDICDSLSLCNSLSLSLSLVTHQIILYF